MKKRILFLREIIKWSIVTYVLGLSLLHIYGNKAIWAPLDAYCPFGGLESLWKFITQGNFPEKIQPSNFALGVALILTALLFGGIFCGWICPLGTLQDGLNRLGKFLRLPQIKIPTQADKILRWLRLPVLILVLLETFKLAKLWFADYDPFRIIFGLHWISEPTSIVFWGWIIGVGFILLSLMIRRFWCNYLCPLGLLVQGVSKVSWSRIRWSKSECSQCDLCSKKCPLGLSVQNPKLNATACNDCLECVANCPNPEALTYRTSFGSGIWVAVTGVAFFAILLLGAQLIGWWNPQITGSPEEIKGWMTLGTISEKYHIPISEFKKELKLPANATADTELRSFEKTVPDFEMDLIRKFVASRIGIGNKQNKDTSVPVTVETNTATAKATSKPTVTDDKANYDQKETKVNDTQVNHVSENSEQLQTSNLRDPEEIRGTMTLTEVSEGWIIPMDILLEKLELPKDIDTKVPIRDLENYGINGMKVREVVKEILKIE